MRIKTIPQIIKAIKSEDSNTAVNESMLVNLITQGKIPFAKRGNRTVIDFDILTPCLNQILALEDNEKIPHIRTIRDANIEAKEKFLDLGIGEKQIREAVQNEKICAIRIGNRSYVAMEFFEEPFVTRIFSSNFDYVAPKKPSRAVEQINELLAQDTKRKNLIRIRK